MIYLFDSSSSLWKSGHEDFYNKMLVSSISESFKLQIKIPFRYLNRNKISKIRIFLSTFINLYKIVKKDKCLTILPTPTTYDILCLYILRYLTKAKIIFFKRRIYDDNFTKDALLNFFLKSLFSKSNFVLVSDSNKILTLENPLNKTFQIDIPSREFSEISKPEEVNIPELASLTFAFTGVLREEKGVYLYEDIIKQTLSKIPYSIFLIHAVANEKNMKNKLDELENTFSSNPRVIFLSRYISDKEYAWILNKIDVLVLPYNVKSYSSGTSGPFMEALSCGKKILSTKLDWAFEKFCNNSNIFWIDDLMPSSIEEALLKLSKDNLPFDSKKTVETSSSFKDSWEKAIKYTINL